MINLTVGGGGRFEEIGSYSRVRRVGEHVLVAGTTATEPSGRLHAPGDTFAQTLYVIERIRAALEEVGAELGHVVRTRAYLSDIDTAGQYVRAHGQAFRGVLPVATAVQAGLTTPGMMVEIEVDAIVPAQE